MKKSKFSEHQIIAMLKAVEAGRTVRDVCREHEVSDATYYKWKTSTVAWKRLTFGACVNYDQFIVTGHNQTVIIKLLLELAHGRPEQGFGKLFKRMRRLGHGWNHKRVYRVYCSLKMSKRRKGKRRLPTRNPAPLAVTQTMNECWSADFMSDALWEDPRFRTFNVVDDFNREALAIEVDLSLTAERVVRVLERIAAVRGYPLKLRSDNGPEFIAVALADWAEQHGVTLEFIKPSKPIMALSKDSSQLPRSGARHVRVQTLNGVREQTEKWLKEYNQERPHNSLGDITPREYLLTQNPEISTYGWT